MATYSALCKKAGLPAPTGFADVPKGKIRRVPPLALQTNDYPDMLKVGDLRPVFEMLAEKNAILSFRQPFEFIRDGNGKFVRYKDRDINAVFCGFVLGCRYMGNARKK